MNKTIKICNAFASVAFLLKLIFTLLKGRFLLIRDFLSKRLKLDLGFSEGHHGIIRDKGLVILVSSTRLLAKKPIVPCDKFIPSDDMRGDHDKQLHSLCFLSAVLKQEPQERDVA